MKQLTNLVQAITNNDEGVQVEADLGSGTFVVNGESFGFEDVVSAVQQFEDVGEEGLHKIVEDETSTKGKTFAPDAGDLKNSIYSGLVDTVGGIPVHDTFHHPMSTFPDYSGVELQLFSKMAEENAKDEKIAQLEAELAELKGEKEKSFPDSFLDISFEATKELDYEEMNDMFKDLEELEVPKYSFITAQSGDTVVIKLHDDRGITYIVSDNYYVLHSEE